MSHRAVAGYERQSYRLFSEPEADVITAIDRVQRYARPARNYRPPRQGRRVASLPDPTAAHAKTPKSIHANSNNNNNNNNQSGRTKLNFIGFSRSPLLSTGLFNGGCFSRWDHYGTVTVLCVFLFRVFFCFFFWFAVAVSSALVITRPMHKPSRWWQ